MVSKVPQVKWQLLGMTRTDPNDRNGAGACHFGVVCRLSAFGTEAFKADDLLIVVVWE